MRATVSHFEIPAFDPARAARFYRKVFGWRIEAVPWAGPGYYSVKTEGPEPAPAGAQTGAIGGGIGRDDVVGSAHPLLVVHVSGASLMDCLLKINRAGGEIVEPPRQVGKAGSFARFRDPEGNLLGLWSPDGH
ncbi:MAG TPA: VOC family protein [Thermoanaerobaculia bacterium]|nr:VOC family protein [Thermoanaerobaculia bacterium]